MRGSKPLITDDTKEEKAKGEASELRMKTLAVLLVFVAYGTEVKEVTDKVERIKVCLSFLWTYSDVEIEDHCRTIRRFLLAPIKRRERKAKRRYVNKYDHERTVSLSAHSLAQAQSEAIEKLTEIAVRNGYVSGKW